MVPVDEERQFFALSQGREGPCTLVINRGMATLRFSLVRFKVVLKGTACLAKIVEESGGASERLAPKWRCEIRGKCGDSAKMLAKVVALSECVAGVCVRQWTSQSTDLMCRRRARA
jgi:hypothetical protein